VNCVEFGLRQASFLRQSINFIERMSDVVKQIVFGFIVFLGASRSLSRIFKRSLTASANDS
jgi:hypothetical protein